MSFTAPADGTIRTLIVHVGGFQSGGTLRAHLSDGSAVDYTDTTTTSAVQYDRNYSLTYKAAGPGQTLLVTWTTASGGGGVTISAAALSISTGSITATAGTPQSATVNTIFGTQLQATVRDVVSNPIVGATVTFTAPGRARARGSAGRRRRRR